MSISRRSALRLFSGAAIAVASGASAQGISGGPVFEGDLILKALPDGRYMRLEQPYGFMDAAGKDWAVPVGATVDGASIPQFLWSLIGGPFEGPYRNASVVHDWYCAVRTETSAATHRMFYDAMLASKVSKLRAKMLYYGVCFGGPKWDDLTIENNRLVTRQAQERAAGRGPATILFPRDKRIQRQVEQDLETIRQRDPEVNILSALAASSRAQVSQEQFGSKPPAESTQSFEPSNKVSGHLPSAAQAIEGRIVKDPPMADEIAYAG